MSERLEIGAEVRVFNHVGTYKVVGYNRDGSYCLYGGPVGHASFRDFRVDLVRPIKVKKERKS